MRGAKLSLLQKVGSLLTAIWLLLATPALAQMPIAYTPGTAQTTILRPGTIVKIHDLDFGQVFKRTTSGTVTIDPFDVRTQTGGELFGTKDYHAAQFAGIGRRNQQVDLKVTPTSIFLTGPGTKMRVRNFTFGAIYGSQIIAGGRRIMIRSTSGGWTIGVGATLEVGANQAPGVYSGTFDVEASYQ
jgi:hypothetical protein